MEARGNIVGNASATSVAACWPDLVTIVDPSWLQAAGLGGVHQVAVLMSSSAARRTLRRYLTDHFKISVISAEAASTLQWLDQPHRSRRLAQRLGACAVVDQIRLCIHGGLVRSLRETLGEEFLASLLGGVYHASNVPLVLPAPSLPANVRSDAIEGFLLGVGKALLLGTVPATEASVRHLIELCLPKQVKSASLEPTRINRAAVLDCLAELSGYD